MHLVYSGLWQNLSIMANNEILVASGNFYSTHLSGIHQLRNLFVSQ